MANNRNRIPITLLASILLFTSVTPMTVLAKLKENKSNTGIIFDDNMEYRDKTRWYEESRSEEMDQMMQRARSLKESGSWGLNGDEISMSGTNFGSVNKENKEYPTKLGDVMDENARYEGENFNPKYWSAIGPGSEFLNQKLSERQRIILMSGIWIDGKKPYSYGGAGRLKKSGSVADCSGTVYQTLTGAGVNVPTSSSGYPGSSLVSEVPWDDMQLGDVVWNGPRGYGRHVEMFIGKKGDKYCTVRSGIRKKGKNSFVDCSRNEAAMRRSFEKVYRPKGRDNPLTKRELEIMNREG